MRSEFFAGGFLYKNGDIGRQQFYASYASGLSDYMYSEALLGRSEPSLNNSTIFSKQILANGVRSLAYLNTTDKWQIILKNEVDFPGVLPISFYCDLMFYRYDLVTTVVIPPAPAAKIHKNINDFIYTGGVQFNMFKRTLEVFIPIFSSSQLNMNFSFLNTIGFKLNLNQLNPVQMVSNASVFGKTGVGAQP